ncbi:hypothetical protein ACFWER_16785, partial [Streptomyces sp. NPDC060188]
LTHTLPNIIHPPILTTLNLTPQRGKTTYTEIQNNINNGTEGPNNNDNNNIDNSEPQPAN